MILVQEEKKFYLKIKGYEFKDSKFSEDLNWLNIEICAKDNFNNWRASGPFLRTNELKELSLWFRRIASNSNIVNRIDFLENELSFQFFIDKNQISVNLDFGFHPNNECYVYDEDKEYKIFFDIDILDISKISRDLEHLILTFPER